MAETKEIKIIRICDADLHGDQKLVHALRRIKGIGFMYANAIVKTLGFSSDKRIEELKDEEIKKVEDAIHNPTKYGIPSWLLNRKKDYVSGEDIHLVSADLSLSNKEDVKRLQEIKSRRGMRLSMGLKVRGQRTKAHPRVGKAVGVKKRKQKPVMKRKKGK